MGTHFSRAISYGLRVNIFIELSHMVYESTFLLELSHMVYGCTLSLELDNMVYGCTFF